VVGLVVVREFSQKMFYILFGIILILGLQSEDFSSSFSWDMLPRAAHSFADPLYDAITNN
jgi:hypothetical protein